MPTNRKRTSRGRRAPPIDSNDWAYLNDEKPENSFTEFLPDTRWRNLWMEYGERITAEWAIRHPGTRPLHWWKFSAPRESPPEEYEGNQSWRWLQPRLQIGGRPVSNYRGALAYDKAVPDWDEEDPDYQADPPVFESELAYLKRHRLLLPGEGKAAK